MDRVFDELADHFWSPQSPPPIRMEEQEESSSSATTTAEASSKKKMVMNRVSSEWAFQRFLQEASAVDQTIKDDGPHVVPPPSSSATTSNDFVEVKDNCRHPSNYNGCNRDNQKMAADSGGPPRGNIPTDSEEYQIFLKSRLELACAAVALTRATNSKLQHSASAASAAPGNGSQASISIKSQPGSQIPLKGAGHNSLKGQDKDASGPLGLSSLSAVPKKSMAQVKSTTSGSSGEQSDDDEGEGETETGQNMDPADAKRVRRMLSNRESARRSRRRKQAHLTELETQVSQLRVENSSLLNKLSDISQKYTEAAVDNRVLKADVETLRAKVKMAEEAVKRVTGLNPLFQSISDMSTMGMPSFASSPSDTSTDAAVPVQVQVQDDTNQCYYKSSTFARDPRFQNGVLDISSAGNAQQNDAVARGNKMGRTVSMRRVASLEHLQKRIRGERGSHADQ